jgi:hypothetical protein
MLQDFTHRLASWWLPLTRLPPLLLLLSRLQVLSAVKEQTEAAEKLIASWADTKPWINENDTKAASDKVRALGRQRCLCWVLFCRILGHSARTTELQQAQQRLQ